MSKLTRFLYRIPGFGPTKTEPEPVTKGIYLPRATLSFGAEAGLLAQDVFINPDPMDPRPGHVTVNLHTVIGPWVVVKEFCRQYGDLRLTAAANPWDLCLDSDETKEVHVVVEHPLLSNGGMSVSAHDMQLLQSVVAGATGASVYELTLPRWERWLNCLRD